MDTVFALTALVAAITALLRRGRGEEHANQIENDVRALHLRVQGLERAVERLTAHPVAPPVTVETQKPVTVAKKLTVDPPPQESAPPYLPPPPRFKVPPATPPQDAPPVFAASTAPRKSIEHQVGTNWLNRIGVTLLVFGIALFLAYQLTHIGPLGKVIAGYAVAATLLAGGLWLERKPKYQVFARAGIGGGWALLFLVTYAMHYFDATLVLQSEFADVLLLFGVGVGMVVHSLRYRSQVVTGLAFLLAFSTVTLSQVTAFSLLASAVLALGLEIVCLREEWFALEIAGIVAAYANHFLWLDRTLSGGVGPGHPFAEFWPSTSVLLLFFVIFRTGYVLRKPKSEEGEVLSAVAAMVNAASVLAIMRYQSFHPEWAFRALLAFGALEAIAATITRMRGRPLAFNVLSVLSSVLFFAAIPFHYHGVTWALLWLLEAEALWMIGFFVRSRALRFVATLAIFGAALVLVADHFDRFFTGDATSMTAFCFALAAIFLWTNKEVLGKRLEEADGLEGAMQIVSAAVAWLAALVALGIWFPHWHVGLAWAVFAAVLFEGALRMRSSAMRWQAYATTALVVIYAFMIDVDTERFTLLHIDRRIVASAVAFALCGYISERLRRNADSLSDAETTGVSGVLATAAATTLSALLYFELATQWLIVGWAAMAVLQLLSALFLRDGIRARAQTLLLVAITALRAFFINFQQEDWRRWPVWITLTLMALCVAIAYQLRKKPLAANAFLVDRPEQPLFFLPLGLLTALLWVEISNAWLTLAWSLLGVSVFLLALVVRERSFRLSGVALLLLGVAKLIGLDVWHLEPTARYLTLIGVGVALLGVSFLYSRHADSFKEYL